MQRTALAVRGVLSCIGTSLADVSLASVLQIQAQRTQLLGAHRYARRSEIRAHTKVRELPEKFTAWPCPAAGPCADNKRDLVENTRWNAAAKPAARPRRRLDVAAVEPPAARAA